MDTRLITNQLNLSTNREEKKHAIAPDVTHYLIDEIWLMYILPYLDALIDLGQLALVSKELMFRYLDNKKDQLDALLTYTQLKDQEKSIPDTQLRINSAISQLSQIGSINKSTLGRAASFVPSILLAAFSVPKFLAYESLENVAKYMIRNVFIATCDFSGSYTTPYDTARDYISYCSHGFVKPDFGNCNLLALPVIPYGGYYDQGLGGGYGCNLTLCESICNTYNTASTNHWYAGFLVAGSALALISSLCCYFKLKCLDHVPTDKIRLLGFFDADFCHEISLQLEIDDNDLQDMSVKEVLDRLEANLNSSKAKAEALLSTMPMIDLKATLFFKQSKTKDCIVQIQDECQSSEDKNSLTQPLLTRQ